MPKSSRAKRWWPSESNAASPNARSQRINSDANSRTGANWGESLAGLVVTVAAAMKWEWVSKAAVSFGQERAVCSPPERATKYREAWRLSKPVASTAVGLSGIRPPLSADATVPWRSRRVGAG
jgi:hypothetical protein